MSHSCLHQPDFIATSIWLHGRVVSSAEVEVAPVGGCSLQGSTKLPGLSYIVRFLGVATELPEETRAGADEERHGLGEMGESLKEVITILITTSTLEWQDCGLATS